MSIATAGSPRITDPRLRASPMVEKHRSEPQILMHTHDFLQLDTANALPNHSSQPSWPQIALQDCNHRFIALWQFFVAQSAPTLLWHKKWVQTVNPHDRRAFLCVVTPNPPPSHLSHPWPHRTREIREACFRRSMFGCMISWCSLWSWTWYMVLDLGEFCSMRTHVGPPFTFSPLRKKRGKMMARECWNFRVKKPLLHIPCAVWVKFSDMHSTTRWSLSSAKPSPCKG